jgi:hypothetical protein
MNQAKETTKEQFELFVKRFNEHIALCSLSDLKLTFIHAELETECMLLEHAYDSDANALKITFNTNCRYLYGHSREGSWIDEQIHSKILEILLMRFKDVAKSRFADGDNFEEEIDEMLYHLWDTQGASICKQCSLCI